MHDRSNPILRSLLIAAISAGCLVVARGAARAQSAEAEALFADGNKLMKQGKLVEACDAFEASNRIEPRAGTLIRLGECREQNHQLASAWSAYKDALNRVKDAKKKAIATAKVKQLDARLSYLTVTVADDRRVDGLTLTRNGQAFDPGLWNRPVPVNGGDYVIAGHAAGREDWQATVKVPGEAGKIVVTVPVLKELPKPPPPAPEPVKPEPSVEAVVDRGVIDEPATRWTTRRKLAVGAGGVAVVGAGVGLALGKQARGKQDDAFALCQDPKQPCRDAARADDLIKQGQHKALLANVSFGVAAAAVVTAGVLWFTGAPSRASVAVVPSIEPGATGFAVLGRF